MRTAGALDGRCYYPNKFHEYTQVQLLSQAPGTALMQVGEAEGTEHSGQQKGSVPEKLKICLV